MAMQALRDGASDGILKFFLFGILALAAGGLVFTDVGGFFRGGVSGSDVAKVGREKISIQTFDRLARRSLAQLGISPQQAYQFGYMQELLGQEINRRLVLRAAEEKGIFVGQDHVVKQIQTIIAPALQNGLRPEDALQTLLRNQGLSEGELTHSIRAESTIDLLNRAIQSGVLQTSNALANDLHAFEHEKRDIQYIAFLDKDVKDIEPPSEGQLLALYEGTKESFATPESRDITLLTLKADTIKSAISIDDAELQAIYDNDIESYTTPETRTIAQVSVQSEDQARAIFEAAQNGKLKDAVKTITGNTSAYLPAKDFDEDSIVEDLKDAVFSAENTGVLEPIKTPLGWTVIALTKIEEEEVQSFAAVRKTIREDLIEERLIDETFDLVDEIDEFFINGGTPEGAIAEFNLSSQSIDAQSARGGNEALNGALGPDAQEALQTAFTLEQGETSSAFELKTGDFAAVHIANITPKSYPPFEDVKADLQTRWMNDQKSAANRTALLALQPTAGAQSLTDIAKEKGKSVRTLRGLKRDSEIQSPLTSRSMAALFAVEAGIPVIVDLDGGVALAEVINVELPKSPKEEDLNAIEEKTLGEIQNEAIALFLSKQQQKHKPEINQALLERAYGNTNEIY